MENEKDAVLCLVEVYICYDREKVNSECVATVQYIDIAGDVKDEMEFNFPYSPLVLEEIEKIRIKALDSGMIYKCTTVEERRDSY